MDTLGVRWKKENLPNTNFLKEIPIYLTDVFNNGDPVSSYGVPMVNGKLKGFKVSITDEWVVLKDSSLQKFAHIDNISPFSKSMIKSALELLSDTIHLPLSQADVFKFHYAIPITLKYDPSLYLNYFGNLGHFKRNTQSSGINYQIANREFCIYDKIKELKSHREYIPPIYQNSNLMRFEYRYNRNLCKHFNLPRITALTLTDRNFYINLNNELYQTYKNIEKLKKIKIDMETITTKKQYEKLGVLSLIEAQGGVLNAIAEINERHKKGKLSKKQAFDLRSLVRECSQMKLQTIESDLILELNQKMKESIRFYR